MEQELISVVMPCYNAASYIAASIDSVLGQTYRNLELLITDDGSDDGTHQLLIQYTKKDPRVKVFMLNSNKGAGFARNNSIEMAQGRYIAFCDCDDIWWPEKLERQVKFMKQNKIALCYTSYIRIKSTGEKTAIVIAPAKTSYRKQQRDNKIGLSTAIYDMKALGHKYYMPTLRKRQDWGLTLLILHDCKVAMGIQDPLAYYTIREESISRNKLSLVKYNIAIYRQILGYSRLRAYLKFYLIFLPNYFCKNMKVKLDSMIYMRHLRKSAH